MPTLFDLLNGVNGIANRVTDAYNDPLGFIRGVGEDAGSRLKKQRLAMKNASDAEQSVMPEVRDAGRREMTDAVMNFGGMGSIASKGGKMLKELLPMPEMATRYPESGFPVLKIDPTSGKLFAGKGPSAEGDQVAAIRKASQGRIDAGDYTPMFDITKREHVDPSNYPRLGGDTRTDAMPMTLPTIEQWQMDFDRPEVRDRLVAAFKEGSQFPKAKDWYAMKQLETAFIDELGPEAGRQAFKDRFADAMAATTGGSDPTANLLTSGYMNFLKTKGGSIPRSPDGSVASHEIPYPVGGPYMASNANVADSVMLQGKQLQAETQPKRYNFSGNFTGRKENQTIDEQMMSLYDPEGALSKGAPPGDSYGILEDIGNQEAAGQGVDPQNFQDVAWLGAKRAKERAKTGVATSEGMPMMEHINQMIQRTSDVSGLSPQEVLRGYIRGTIPIFGLSGVTLGGLLQQGLNNGSGNDSTGIQN